MNGRIRCEYPTLRKFDRASGTFLNNLPGKCDNFASVVFGKLQVCRRHFNAAVRKDTKMRACEHVDPPRDTLGRCALCWPGGTPKVGRVVEYCAEEVRRQGHDLLALDGIERVGWMLEAWAYALMRNAERRGPLGAFDAVQLGRLIEPQKNFGGIRTCWVHVDGRQCPDPALVPAMLDDLFLRDGLSSMDFYKLFEEIHPFVDGNGRTGKILLNWLSGTLLSPIFPPNDLWGGWIENP